ncbi:DUF3027 domain-containing protein [Streptomyces sp. YIM 98790]|uniref:DUF3027 domain-containing protein n=1 Tax=Streptomyces sp. YIM 98790 TaxID=2689077 RepID=UPI00140E6B6C|nr:DUF3027 domain-containing protein [Streptomyces sp. YIM 98790]
MKNGHAAKNPEERDKIHARWIEHRNRRTEDPDYPEEWYFQQCGGCRYWVPLAGKLGLDYGACANQRSPFDASIRFEHDGCEAYEESGEEWAIPDDFPTY